PVLALGRAQQLPAPRDVRRSGVSHFVVQQVADGAVELRAIGAGEHHLEIAALLPVPILAELRLHGLVKLGAGKRIGNAHTDVIGARLLDEPARGEYVLEFFTEIPELQEIAHADAGSAQQAARFADLGDACALVHGIEDLLAAALGSDPYLAAAGGLERLGHARAHEIGAQLDGERHAAAAFGERRGEFLHPVDAEAKDVVGKPDVI